MSSILKDFKVFFITLLVLATLIVLASIIAFFYGPLAGYRYYQPVTLYEITETDITGNTVTARISNRELNPVTLDVWFEMAQPGGETYRSERERLAPLLPEQSIEVQLQIPDEHLPLANMQSVEVKISEVIAYVRNQADINGSLVMNEPVNDNPVNLALSSIEPLDARRYRFRFDITIDNQEDRQEDFRYSITIHRGDGSNNLVLLNESVFTGDFSYIVLNPDEAVTVSSEFELAINPGEYAVSLWVQRLDENDRYVHFWQTRVPGTVKITRD